MLCSTSMRILSAALCLACLGSAVPALGQPQLRWQDDVHGDFVLIGNTLLHDCGEDNSNDSEIVSGRVQLCINSNLDGPEAFWAAGQDNGVAVATTTFTSADSASSAAMLEIPEGAEVAYARLYWTGFRSTNQAGNEVDFAHSGFTTPQQRTVIADTPSSVARRGDTPYYYYQASSDVTSLVKQAGSGVYTLSQLTTERPLGRLQGASASWQLLVVYERDGDPTRQVTIFDGLQFVDQQTSPVTATITGFEVPDHQGFDAKIGVVAFDGQAEFLDDVLEVNGTRLVNAANPSGNFFNGTRSDESGLGFGLVGDDPQLTGDPGSYANLDMDVVNVRDLIDPGDTSATISASTGTGVNADVYVLGMLVTSITTLKPVFTDSLKTVEDLTGDPALALPGDELRYTIVVRNTGSDKALDTVLRDEIPEGTTYVPGSIVVGTGNDAQMISDAANDDQGEFDVAGNQIVVRLGTGATAAQGGDLDIGEEVTVTFNVTIDLDISGQQVSNQGIVTARGDEGSPEEEFPTDGDPDNEGPDETVIDVHECATNEDCPDDRPNCDMSGEVNVCVGCARDSDCTDPDVPDCNLETQACYCPSGPGNCQDSDNDGVSDETEIENGTDPFDADTDDDGALDGEEYLTGKDSDGDGLINGRDPDSDDDGLFDGTEIGNDCSHPDTDLSKRSCRPDQDDTTTTSPIDKDSDNGGTIDGSEDFNFDGAQNGSETDPNDRRDDDGVVDTDKDGLSDGFEGTIHSDSHDADSDEDGLPDGDEPNPSHDGDLDGLVTVNDPDSDDDALFDGTETGRGCDDNATIKELNHCRADGDEGETRTSPVNPNSDGEGFSDGSEDQDLDGVVDSGETDPNNPDDDDSPANVDTDEDGLTDGLEDTLNSDKNDKDSDDDGLLDGDENNPSDQTDRDGSLNINDEDSDGDGLGDGLEAGTDCLHPDTDTTQNNCTADDDGGTATTSTVNPDTDYGGTWDGVEDDNENGRIDSGETDPNDPADDAGCSIDTDCGGLGICDDTRCVDRCRDDSDCPDPNEECRKENEDDEFGVCAPGQITPPSTSGDTMFGGGGPSCAVGQGRGGALFSAFMLLGCALFMVFRRRQS